MIKGNKIRVVGGIGKIKPPTSTTSTPAAFSAQSVVLTSNSSYTVPAGATSMKVWVIGGGGAWSNYCDGGADRDGGNGAVAVRTYSVSGGTASYSIGAGDTYNCNNAKFAGSTTLTYGGVSIVATGGRSQNNEWAGMSANNGCTNATTCGTAGSNVDGLNAAVTLAGGSISGRGIGGVGYGASGGAGAVVLYFT